MGTLHWTRKTTMKVATFNINGIKARAETLKSWLDETSPEIVLLQEIKSTDEAFPHEFFDDTGYMIRTHGQKSYNGVAIFSKLSLEDVRCGLPGNPQDEQARWIEATVIGRRALKICGLYLPNGNPVPGPKFDYKLDWMERMLTHVRNLISDEMPLLLAGDFNVIPQDEDAKDPKSWIDDALARPETRTAFRRILNLGFTDAFRARNFGPDHYSFWDYQAGAWQKNNGIRIDHILLSPQATDLLQDCQIDTELRGRNKPSDHVPVWVDLDL